MLQFPLTFKKNTKPGKNNMMNGDPVVQLIHSGSHVRQQGLTDNLLF